MFKIGEFSKLTQVSIRMLRYYDEIGLLNPAVVEETSGYRLYAANQIPIVNKITFLRDLGFQAPQIKTALQDWNTQNIRNLLEEKQKECKELIQAEQERLNKIETAKKDFLAAGTSIHYKVSVKTVPSYQVLSLRRVIPNYYHEGALWKELAQYAEKNNVRLDGDTFSIYHDEDYREESVDVELCAPTPTIIKDSRFVTCRCTEAVPLMGFTMVFGAFENIAGVFNAFARWLEKHEIFEMAGPTRQIVHRGPWNEEDISQYVTEIQIPLKKKDSVLT